MSPHLWTRPESLVLGEVAAFTPSKPGSQTEPSVDIDLMPCIPWWRSQWVCDRAKRSDCVGRT